MSLSRAGINQAIYHLDKASRDMDTVNRRLNTGRKIHSAKDDPAEWSKLQMVKAAGAGVRNVNDTLTLVAGNILAADGAMEMIGRYIGMMKADLEAIIKNYPPYPMGDPKRAKYLRSFIALRDEIDRITIPPRDPGAKKIMSDPSVNPGAGDWDVIINSEGARAVIHSRQVHTGPAGLDIPALSETSTDAEITAAIDRLDHAMAILSSRRAGLGADFAGVKRGRDINEKMGVFFRKEAERIEAVDMNEAAALAKSIEVRHAIQVESLKGLSDSQAMFLELLG